MDLNLSLNLNQSSLPPVELAEVTALLSATSAMYDPSDLSTLWTDDARTTNVTTDGDAVAVMDDISGNGNHMRQTTVSARPLYKTDGTKHWLQPDGVSHWMRSNPFFALGTTWTHVGGWQCNGTSDRAFTTSFDFMGAVRDVNTGWFWYDAAGSAQEIATGDPVNNHTLAIVRDANTSIYGRYNGGGSTTIVPHDLLTATDGLALFTQRNDALTSGLDGKFYGGLWDAQIYTTANIELVERFYRQQAGL